MIAIISHSTPRSRVLALTAAWLATLTTITPARAALPTSQPPPPSHQTNLFQITNIWTVHLRFTPDQWKAMEPEGGAGFPFIPGGPPPAQPAPSNPPFRPQPNPGLPRPQIGAPPGNFGPGFFIAPVFLQSGDANRDATLSAQELASLGRRWFDEWDQSGSGTLNASQLRTGLNRTFQPPPATLPINPNSGPRPNPPPGRPGFSLQGAEGRRNGLASALGIEFTYVRADLEFGTTLITNVAVRYKGNGTFLQSRASLKRSLKIDLNEFTKGRRLAGQSKLNLHNCVTDATWMNEVLSYRLFRDAGVPAPRTAYARVYVSVPHLHDRRYFGLYSLVENVDDPLLQDHFATRPGALFKPVTPTLFADLGPDWQAYRQSYDPKNKVAPSQTARLIAFAQLVTHADDPTFAAQVADYLDLGAFARFMAVTVWLSTLDSILGPGQNFYLYLHPENQRFYFLPWDLDHSFGQFSLLGTQPQREQLSLLHPWQGENRFLQRVFSLPSFKSPYLAALRELNQTLCQPARLRQQVDETALAIRPAIAEESQDLLNRFDRTIAGDPVTPWGPGGPDGPGPAGPGAPGGPLGFFQPPKPIKGFVQARWNSVHDQLEGRSQGQTIASFGFGPPDAGRRPDPRPAALRNPSGSQPGGPDFGPGTFLGPAFMTALDADRDGSLTRSESTEGFARWAKDWDTDTTGTLSETELRTGLNQALAFSPHGPPPSQPPNPDAP